MITSIYDLAELAVTKVGLKGIDWAALTAQGRGTVWDRDYINNYMIPAQIAMITNVGGMVFDVGGSPAAVQQSYTMTDTALQSVTSSILAMANLPNANLMQIEIGLSREAVRTLVSHAYQVANYAFLLHADETIHHSGLSDAEIAAHANTAVGCMNALVLLRNMGLYKALGIDESQNPGPPAQNGLGVIPIPVIIGIVVVAVVALIVLAWIVVSYLDLSQKNKVVAKVCENAQAAGDAATTQQCIATLTDPNKNAGTMVPSAIKQALVSLIPYALGGVAIYALFLSAPYIVKNLLTKKATA